jgi:3-deoxy-D-manno-octulosonic acid kinase
MVLAQEQVPALTKQRLADPRVRQQLFARAPRRGRGTAPSVELDHGTSTVLRRYQHGGALAWLARRLFWGPTRPLQELRVTARAESSGAPVPRVMCLVLWPVFGPFWSAMIGTREERPARELLGALQECPDEAACVRLGRQVGAAIRKLHDAGVEHRDLQLRNILVADGDDARIVVVDLDRAVFHRYGRVPASKRARNLGRLARSTVKCGLWGDPVGRRTLAAFSGAYASGNRDLRAELRGFIGRERLKLLAHRLTYPLRSV